MTRVPRSVILVAVGAVVGVVAPASPAQGGGPETALGNICEHVSRGTWNASTLGCLTGTDNSIPAAAFAVCEHALDGTLLGTALSVPGQPPQFGWVCVPD